MSTIKAEWTNADALDLQPTCNQLATDCISRQAAIDAVGSMLRRKFGIGGDLAEITLTGLPSAQQDCTECAEYDNETHSCQKYCEVIRKTVEEVKERTGRWIQHEDTFLAPYYCSECGAVCRDIRDEWCYGCGARMEGEG